MFRSLTRAGILVAVCAALAGTALAAQPTSSFRFQWANRTTLEVRGRTYVWCGRWDDGARVRTLRIQQASLAAPPWWSLEVRLTVARRGRRIDFPTLSSHTAAMFVGYPRKSLEASTDSERSRGSLTILGDVTCRPGSPVRLSVGATLAGEESGGPSIRVQGVFSATVGTTPAPGTQP